MRQQRRREQSKNNQNSVTGKKNWLFIFGIVLVFAAITIVVVSRISSYVSSAETEPDMVANGGSVIGDPNAPVTLVEFGDFQ